MPNAPVVHSLPGLALAPHRDQLHVVATTTFAVGSAVLTIDGTTRDRPTRHTLQIDRDVHVDAQIERDGRMGFLPWRWLDHGCAPVTHLVGRALVAHSPIAPGDLITFDYETTEWDMAAPFACHCGAAGCRGEIRGYRHLGEATRARLRWVTPHLLAHAGELRMAAR
ncbi:MAG: hypothetical protein JNK15_05150 [Planctomycetes bacterium]|nr:hypothetical protein [Planctomycetota bacterium]